jgi:LPXTG-motif cell wall-anchored protein
LVIGDTGDPVTYCFRVVNTGNAHLFPVTIDDDILGITDEDMDVVSGDPTVPLAPGDEVVFAYETTITATMINVAVVTGTPTDPDGDPLVPETTVTDDNDARVNLDVDADPGQDDDDDDPTLPRTGTSTTDQILFGLGLLSLGGAMLMFNRLSDRRRRPQAELGGGSTANPV